MLPHHEFLSFKSRHLTTMRVTFKFFNPSVTEITDHCGNLKKPCSLHTVMPDQITVIVDNPVLSCALETVS